MPAKSTALRTPSRVGVPVAGGELTVAVWGDLDAGSPPVLAIHGITASSRAWIEVATRLSGPVIAPDLRGRGGSELPGPYGMAAHAADCVAVLDALGVERAIVVGHSMGGFVASVLAHRSPARVARLVLVDGGAPLPPLDAGPEAALGPAARRLEMHFESNEAYRDYWRAHPSFAQWSPAVAAYVDYDLIGDAPKLRSRVSAQAMRTDFTDLHTGAAAREAFAALPDDVPFLRAERGMFNETTPLYPDLDVLSRFAVTNVPDVNHYSILFTDAGVRAVVESLS